MKLIMKLIFIVLSLLVSSYCTNSDKDGVVSMNNMLSNGKIGVNNKELKVGKVKTNTVVRKQESQEAPRLQEIQQPVGKELQSRPQKLTRKVLSNKPVLNKPVLNQQACTLPLYTDTSNNKTLYQSFNNVLKADIISESEMSRLYPNQVGQVDELLNFNNYLSHNILTYSVDFNVAEEREYFLNNILDKNSPDWLNLNLLYGLHATQLKVEGIILRLSDKYIALVRTNDNKWYLRDYTPRSKDCFLSFIYFKDHFSSTSTHVRSIMILFNNGLNIDLESLYDTSNDDALPKFPDSFNAPNSILLDSDVEPKMFETMLNENNHSIISHDNTARYATLFDNYNRIKLRRDK